MCAAIDNNPDNVAYVAFARERYQRKIHVVADLDCTWSDHYHPARCRRALARPRRPLSTRRLHPLCAQEKRRLADERGGRGCFELAEQRGLFVSLAAGPAWQADLRAIAVRHPSVPVLCHHLGGLLTITALGAMAGAGSAYADALAEVTTSVKVANIFVKVSGFHYASAQGWDYPWEEAIALFRRLFEALGRAGCAGGRTSQLLTATALTVSHSRWCVRIARSSVRTTARWSSAAP